MTMTEAISAGFTKYFVFSGRSSRSEYWWFILFAWIISTVLQISTDLSSMRYPDYSDFFDFMNFTVAIGVCLPSFAVASRRLHDVGKSGWWQTISLTLIGLVPLLVWLVRKGGEEPNQYGDSPI